MATIKVLNGTRSDGSFLCDTCRNATIRRGAADSQEVIICGALSPAMVLPFKAVECSDYDDKRHASRYDVEKIAWVLVTKSSGREAGFIKAREYRKMRDKIEAADDSE